MVSPLAAGMYAIEPVTSIPASGWWMGVPRTRIERIASEQTSISTDTAFRLAKIFQTTPEFWMNMQTSHDLKLTKDQVDVSHIDILKTA
uniref:Addiction module antidote protein, HigA family n=1 Tax=OCS116 cluster bacterium TaxID=2030921 RepID=A0A2A4Z9A1_9PROT